MAPNASPNKQKNHSISVIIATKNRPTDIRRCLQSLENSVYKNFEVIVADQSDNPNQINKTDYPGVPQLLSINTPEGGKAAAINEAIKKARGDMLVFTDDDCVVSRQWLSIIDRVATKQPVHSAFFGKTRPHEPHKHAGLICPSTFTKSVRSIISSPRPHFLHIGFGNNMAIRASAIASSGGFKSWLGPGSIGNNAEDAEMALRLLIQHHTILYEPTMIVFHNRWITANQMRSQYRSYTCGETACYGYFFFQGFAFASPVLISNIKTTLRQLFSGRNMFHESLNLLGSMFGLFVGLWYAWRDPIISTS